MGKRRDEQRDQTSTATRRTWLVFAGVMVLGVGIYGVRACQRDAEQRTIAERQRVAGQAWANLQHCALGGPVGGIKNLDRRERLIELAGARTGEPDGWPTGCAQHATELYQVLADKGAVGALKVQLAERLGCAEQCALRQPAVQLRGLGQLAQQAGLPVVTATVAAPPLLEHKLLHKSDLVPLTPWNATLADRDVLEDGKVRLLFSSKAQGPQLCELRPDEAGGSCNPVAIEGNPTGLRLEPGGEIGILSRPGEQGRTYHRADTGAAVSVHQGQYRGLSLSEIGEQEYEVAVVEDGKARGQTKLKLPQGSSTPWLMAGHLAWLDGQADATQTLQLRRLDDDGAVAAKLAVAGVPGQGQPPAVCRTGEGAVALFGSPARPRALVFYDGTVWSDAVVVDAALQPGTAAPAPPPVEASAQPPPSAAPSAVPRPHQDAAEFGIVGLLGSASPAIDPADSPWGKVPGKTSELFETSKPRGAARHQGKALQRRRARPGVPVHAFACTPGQATITWRVPRPRGDEIHQLRCDAQGCEGDVAVIEGLTVKVWWLATALGPRTLLVWRARGGELRMRLAPLAELPTAKDVLIMDSEGHGGPKTLGLEAFVGSSAVVFLFRDVGYQGLRIDAQGRFGSLLR